MKTSSSFAEVQRKLHLSNGLSRKSVRDRILHEKLDVSHFKRKYTGGGFVCLSKEEALATLFNAHSLASQATIRRYVIRYNLLPIKCDECPITNMWNGKPLSLQLDHRDGNNLNHNLTNLRWLCPCCHSQTTTFSGKRRRLRPICLTCGVPISFTTKSQKCRRCGQVRPTKIAWPTDEELHTLIWSIPTSSLAKKLGVSDKAIEKRCKSRNIIKPSGTYWSKGRKPTS